MISVHDLPAVNASLNAASAALLVLGFVLIRRKQVVQHRRVMVTAFAISVLFLISYLVYHAQVGSVRFQGTGAIRIFYFSVLLTHTVLAAAVPFLAGFALWRGWTGNYAKHRRVARWAFPIWLYVSVTGVVVYWMLYRL